MGVPIEKDINSREPKYNCFFKRFFYFSLFLSFSFNAYFLKESYLVGMLRKPLPLPNTAVLQMSLICLTVPPVVFPFLLDLLQGTTAIWP